MAKKILFNGFLFFCVFCVLGCNYFQSESKNNNDSNQLTKEDFERFIEQKKYTILYFWVNWCPLSQEGLVNDYCINYIELNNDSIQTMLIVMSDTAFVNKFMSKNNVAVPYEYVVAEKNGIISNFNDEKNKKKIMLESFNYDISDGFPNVILVDSLFEVINVSSHTKWAKKNIEYLSRMENDN